MESRVVQARTVTPEKSEQRGFLGHANEPISPHRADCSSHFALLRINNSEVDPNLALLNAYMTMILYISKSKNDSE